MYWYHPDHLGSSSFTTGIDGEVNQNIEYFPSGEVFLENHLNSYNTPYKFNSKELDDETGYYYYGARYYNPRTSLWLSVDPLAEKMPSWSPYNYTFNNPVKYTDPYGREPFNEYDKNGKMISNLGGNKIDFYHQKNGDTKVVSRQTGASNVIKGGESIISGYTHRGKDVGWGTITGEFFGGDGPTRSLFSDFNDSNSGPFASLDRVSSPYSSLARQDALNSKNSKGVVKMDYSHANPLTANFDGYEQMWGRSNVSWYKLGDETLFLMTDSKSQESLFYRLPVNNFERTEGKVNSFGNTYQTYIWTEGNSEVQKKAINPTLKNVFKQAITPPSILTRP